ncbi:hypothetical protein BS47DRAFT_1346340, partial [Hydnum rufescens UP504]
MPRLDSNSLLSQCGPAITYANGPKAHLTYREARGRPHAQLPRDVLMPSNSTTLVPSDLGEIWRGFRFFSLHSLNSVLNISLVLGNTYVITPAFPPCFLPTLLLSVGLSH